MTLATKDATRDVSKLREQVRNKKLREMINEEEASAEEILRGEFMLEEKKLSVILSSIAQQLQHTRTILRLARDQAQQDKQRTISALSLIRKTIKTRQHNDFENEYRLRSEEYANIEKEIKAKVTPIQSPRRVKGIMECSNLMLKLLDEEVEIFDTIMRALSDNKFDILDATWSRLINLLEKEKLLIGQLRALY